MFHKLQQIYQILFSNKQLFVVEEITMKELFEVMTDEEKNKMLTLILEGDKSFPNFPLKTGEFFQHWVALRNNIPSMTYQDDLMFRKICSKFTQTHFNSSKRK